MPFSLLNERSQVQSSGVTWRGGGREKLDDLSTGSSLQKRNSVWTEVSVRTTCWIQPAPERSPVKKVELSLDKASVRTRSLRSTSSRKRHSPVKKERKRPPSTILKYSKKERNCKGSVSSIVKFIEWTLLHAPVWQLRHFYSSKRKKEKEEKRIVQRHFCLMFSCWLDIAGILKNRKEKGTVS